MLALATEMGKAEDYHHNRRLLLSLSRHPPCLPLSAAVVAARRHPLQPSARTSDQCHGGDAVQRRSRRCQRPPALRDQRRGRVQHGERNCISDGWRCLRPPYALLMSNDGDMERYRKHTTEKRELNLGWVSLGMDRIVQIQSKIIINHPGALRSV